MSYFRYAFAGPVVHHDLGTMRYTVLWLPDEVAADLPLKKHPRLRISGELNEQPFSGAWQPSRGHWYLMLGKPLLKSARLGIGDTAELRFRLEPIDQVDIPSILTRAIEASQEATAAWEALPAGKQRAIAIYIDAAKTGPTLAKRAAQAVQWLSQGETDLRRLNKLAPEPGKSSA